eukprot:1196107-Prorocentrum_minimum.AAC.2
MKDSRAKRSPPGLPPLASTQLPYGSQPPCLGLTQSSAQFVQNTLCCCYYLARARRLPRINISGVHLQQYPARVKPQGPLEGAQHSARVPLRLDVKGNSVYVKGNSVDVKGNIALAYRSAWRWTNANRKRLGELNENTKGTNANDASRLSESSGNTKHHLGTPNVVRRPGTMVEGCGSVKVECASTWGGGTPPRSGIAPVSARPIAISCPTAERASN